MGAFDKILLDYERHCQRIAKATTIDINEMSGEKYVRIKNLENKYTAWFEYYFPNYAKVKCAKFHKKLAKKIIGNKVINVLAEIYRSGGKSVHIDMGIPLYLMVTGKLHFMLLVGETEPKAKKLLSDIQAQLQYNQRFINDYGKKFKYGDWADGKFSTIDGVYFYSLGIGQSPRGIREMNERPDYIVLDDVDNKKRVKNDKLSREAFEWVWEDLQGCFDEGGERRRFVAANNNFHKNTIVNQLKKEFERINKEAKEYGDDIEHYILTVKAVKDLSSFEPAWPEKTDEAYWRRKFRKTPYRSFMREYMHVHIHDGTIFKHENIRYAELPRIDSFDALCFYGDLSYKDKACYKALILIGKKDKFFYIIKAFVRQTSRANCAIWLYNTYENMNLEKYNVRYLIEGLFAMDEFVNDFDEEGRKRGYFIPVVPDMQSKGDKFDRIEGMCGFFERGDMLISTKEKEDPDMLTLVDQLLTFEKGSGAAVDGPDALQGGTSYLNKVCFVEKFEPRIIPRPTSKNKY